MALNWTMLNDDRSPVPLPNEMTITTVGSGADLSLTIPETVASADTASSASGPSATPITKVPGGRKKLKTMGKIWLTDQRLLFVSNPNGPFDTLSVPLPSILSTRYEQPTFGANYLTFDVKPTPAGGLTEGTSVILKFKDRAMFEFVSLVEKTRERAIYMKRQMQLEEDEEGLPSYSAPAESSSAVATGNVPVENPPGYDY
ncbi:hypothetical protein AX15_007412 [Amanita polypyramis BW_CC]|nr:hypothetical protein AX15_007412 [Amanita polypyramis BW_CC]